MNSKTTLALALATALTALGGLAQAQTTLNFQTGLNAYAGTQDTVLRSADPTGNYGAAVSISVDGDDGSPGLQPNHGLIRFDAVFGTGAGQIQMGDTITSATLTLNVTNPGSGWRVHDMLSNWSQATATWANLGSGIQADGIEAAMMPILSLGSDNGSENVPVGLLTMDVTTSLLAWQAGTLPGFGWALLPFTNGTNGIDFDTSESSNLNARPLLSVLVTPVPEPGSVALMLAGLAALLGLARRPKAL